MNPISGGNCNNISKIYFTLHIISPDSVKRIKQKLRIDTINSSVNFPNPPFCGGSILFFDNLHNISVFIGDNPSIIVRRCYGGRHHR